MGYLINSKLSSGDLSQCLHLVTVGFVLMDSRFHSTTVIDWCIYFDYLSISPQFVSGFTLANRSWQSQGL